MNSALSFRSWASVGCVFGLLSCGGTVQIGGDERRGTGGTSGGGGDVAVGGRGSPGGASGAFTVTGGKTGIGGKTGSGGLTGAGGAAQKPCDPGLLRCGTQCVDISSDGNNCGGCFSTCGGPGVQCVGGSCQKVVTGPGGCKSFETYCSNFGECLDLQTNLFVCGSCFTPCGNGEQCINGLCQVGTCASGAICKSPDGSTHCPDVNSDSKNCGGCNNVCPDGIYCEGGKCAPPDCGGSTFCGLSGCVDTPNDVSNCGGCGISCTGGPLFDFEALACTKGLCGCAPTANPCGAGCASDFWYCPAPGFMGSAFDLCTASARNNYERCACKGCLQEVQACSSSPTCVNAMDCTLRNVCVGCQPTFTSCTDTQKGTVTDPIADKLVACLNAQCPNP